MTEPSSLSISWPDWVNPPAIHYNQHLRVWHIFYSLKIGAEYNRDRYGYCSVGGMADSSATGLGATPEEANAAALAAVDECRLAGLARANALPPPAERPLPRGLAPKITQETQDLLDLLDL